MVLLRGEGPPKGLTVVSGVSSPCLLQGGKVSGLVLNGEIMNLKGVFVIVCYFYFQGLFSFSHIDIIYV